MALVQRNPWVKRHFSLEARFLGGPVGVEVRRTRFVLPDLLHRVSDAPHGGLRSGLHLEAEKSRIVHLAAYGKRVAVRKMRLARTERNRAKVVERPSGLA